MWTGQTDPARVVPQALRDQFNSVELVDDFWSQYHGRPMTHFFHLPLHPQLKKGFFPRLPIAPQTR